MASDVQIAKLALQHLGDRYDIQSLADETPEAEQVLLVYTDVRDALLREHPWSFARKFVSPAALTGTPPASWSYMFAYPTDCVRVIKVVNPLGDAAPPIRFTVGINTSDVSVILCNESEPTFECTKRVTDPQRFDPEFVTAFSYRLAEAMAIPLTGDRGLLADMRGLANAAVSRATSTSANEGFEEPSPAEATWITARS